MDVTENDGGDDGVEQPFPMEELPEEEAPEGIEQDALKELTRLHEELDADPSRFQQQEEPFDPSYGMGGGMGGGFPAMPEFQPVVERTPRREENDFPGAREHKTLEDLYATWPDIGNGEYYLRVERKHPASYQGQRVVGFLEDLHHQISMREFSDKYGGHTYEVSVRGPSRSSGDGSDRTLKTIKIQVPGPPKTLSSDVEFGRSNGRGSRGDGNYSENVELRKMELSFQERQAHQRREDAIRRQQREEQRREAMRQEPMMRSTLEELRRLHSQQTSTISGVHKETIQKLGRDLEGARSALERKDQVIQQLRDDLLEVKAEASNRWKEEESRQIRDLKERQSSDMQRISEEHAATVGRLQSEHDRRIQSMTEAHQRELSGLRDAEARERERLRDDANRREQALQDEANRREQQHRDREQLLRDEFTRREESMRHDMENRIQMMERQNKRDLEMIRSTESSKAVFTEQTAGNQMSFLNMQLKQAQQAESSAMAEAAQLREELMRYTNKPLLQQVEETKTIGEALGLFEAKPEKRDWKESLVDGVSNALQKAPEMMQAVMDTRQQNQNAVVAARHAQAQRAAAIRQQQANALASPPPMVPSMMGPAPAPQAVAPAPPPAWDQGPSDPSQGPPVPVHMQGPPMQEPPQPSFAPDVAPPRQPVPPPVIDEPQVPVAAAPDFAMGPEIKKTEQPESGHQQSASGQETAPPSGPHDPFAAPGVQADSEEQQDEGEEPSPQSAGGHGFEMNQESILRFVEQLELAIGFGVVTPKKFAEKFIEEAGAEATAQLIQQVTPDQLIQLVEENAKEQMPNIASRSGRKYITALWEQAGQLVAQAG